ncbi:MAG: hypothetical protein ACI85O_001233 [Saprospiraceae bacterium]|jgi:hypothetical protein
MSFLLRNKITVVGIYSDTESIFQSVENKQKAQHQRTGIYTVFTLILW